MTTCNYIPCSVICLSVHQPLVLSRLLLFNTQVYSTALKMNQSSPAPMHSQAVTSGSTDPKDMTHQPHWPWLLIQKSRCHIKPLKSAQVWYPFEKRVTVQAGSEGVCKTERCEPHITVALGATVKRHCFNIREAFLPVESSYRSRTPHSHDPWSRDRNGWSCTLRDPASQRTQKNPQLLSVLITQSADTQNPPQKLSFSGVGRRHLVTVLGQP